MLEPKEWATRSDLVVVVRDKVAVVRPADSEVLYEFFPVPEELQKCWWPVPGKVQHIVLENRGQGAEVWQEYIKIALASDNPAIVLNNLASVFQRFFLLTDRGGAHVAGEHNNRHWVSREEMIITANPIDGQLTAQCLNKLMGGNATLKEKLQRMADVGVYSVGTVHVLDLPEYLG